MFKKVFSRQTLLSEKAIVVYFVLLKLAICLFPLEYGVFRDELYYIVLGENLDFGYVDVPPLTPLILALVRSVVGTSLFALHHIPLHLVPAMCGAAVVVLVSLMVKKMGGGFHAQFLVLTCVTLAPIYICWESIYSYDAFDKLWWTLALYIMVLLFTSEDKKYWIYFGIAAGVGLLTKITMLYLGLGICAALLLTRDRKYFLSWQLWAGAAIAFLIFSPYILWQIKEGLPALEYYKNYVFGKTYPTKPWQFVKDQIVMVNLVALPVWLAGLYYFIFNEKGKRFKALGYAYIVILVICIIQQVKFYLPAPFYTVLFAGGAVFIEAIAEKSKIKLLKRKVTPTGLTVTIFIIGLLSAPVARPMLPVKKLMKWTGDDIYMGVKGERHKLDELHQHFADRLGWPEMVATVAQVYNNLDEEEKAKACILTGNCGEAGAIWVLGDKYNLPKPISGHLQYYLWGPMGCSGEIVISLGVELEILKKCFGEVEKVAETKCKLAIPYENRLPIYMCRKPVKPLEELWPVFKHFD